MGVEIERKHLILNDDWRKSADAGVFIQQGYLAESSASSVRVRIEGAKANINIKSAGINIERSEYEYSIPVADAKEMMKGLLCKPPIEKTRYHVHYAKKLWEIDVFSGDNAGLVVAEIELDSLDEKYEHPAWLGKEVSNEARYYNMNLALNPYKDW